MLSETGSILLNTHTSSILYGGWFKHEKWSDIPKAYNKSVASPHLNVCLTFRFFALTVMLYFSQGSFLGANKVTWHTLLLEAFHIIYSTSLCCLLVVMLFIIIVVIDPNYWSLDIHYLCVNACVIFILL